MAARNINNIAKDGLKLWYPLDGHFEDLSGNGNHPTSVNSNLYNSFVPDMRGNNKGALQMGGTDWYGNIDFVKPINQEPANYLFTFSMWVKFIRKYGSLYALYHTYNGLSVEWSTTNKPLLYENGSRYRYGNTSLGTDTWRYITVVNDYANAYRIDFYIDGVLYNGSGGGTQLGTALASNWFIGPNENYKLEVCDVRIYDIGWASDDVKHYYEYSKMNRFNGTSNPTVFQINYPESLFITDFSVSNENKIFDQSGNINNNELIEGELISSTISSNGLNLNGTTGYVSLPQIMDYNQTYEYITIMSWFKMTSRDTNNPVFMNNKVASPYSGVMIRVNSNGNIESYITPTSYISSEILEVDKYYFVCAVYYIHNTNGWIKHSVNGKSYETIFQGDTTNAQPVIDNVYGIGNYTTQYFHGNIYFTGLFKKYFSEIELNKIYRYTRLSFPGTENTILTSLIETVIFESNYSNPNLPKIYNILFSNLKVLYDFSEENSDIVNDKSGNNNHSTIYTQSLGNTSSNQVRSTGCLTTDGIDDYIKGVIVQNLDSFTIECWFSLETEAIAGLIGITDSNSKRRDVYIRNRKIGIIPYLDNKIHLTQNDVLEVGELYHLVATSNGTNEFKLYLNAVEITGFNQTAKPLLYDYNIWADGQSGNIGPFTAAGNLPQTRIIAEGPFGEDAIVWQTYDNQGIYPGKYGGIYNTNISIDNTQLYRMSWWERRVVNDTVYGRQYFGLLGYGSVNGVSILTNTTPNTNPYYASFNYNYIANTSGNWYLYVGHVFPYNTSQTTSHTDSGLYLDKNRTRYYVGTDYKFLAETTSVIPRTLTLYYSATIGATHHSVYPRMDLCDGTEPTIQDLLNGYDVTNNTYIDEIALPLSPNSLNIAKLDITQNLYGNLNIYKVAIYDSILTNIDIARVFNYEKRFFNNVRLPMIKFNQVTIERPEYNLKMK